MKLKHLIIIALLFLVLTILIQKGRGCEFVCLARTDMPTGSLLQTNDILAIFADGTYDNIKKINPTSDMLDAKKFYWTLVPDLSDKDAQKYVMKTSSIGYIASYKIDTTKVAITDGKATETKATIDNKVINRSVAEALPE